MLDMQGHSIYIRKPRADDDPRQAPGYGDLQGTDLKREDVAMVVMGEDLGVCLILAVGHNGERLFEETSEPREVLDLYYLAACTANKALELSQQTPA